MIRQARACMHVLVYDDMRRYMTYLLLSLNYLMEAKVYTRRGCSSAGSIVHGIGISSLPAYTSVCVCRSPPEW